MTKARNAGMAKGMWEKIKAEEKARKAGGAIGARPRPGGPRQGLLDGVPVALPALTRALKLQEKAARVGFDWSEAAPILDKIEEEIGELREAMAQPMTGRDQGRVRRRAVCAGQFRPAPEDRSRRQRLRGTNEKFRSALPPCRTRA